MGTSKKLKVGLIAALCLVAVAIFYYASRLLIPTPASPENFTTEVVERGNVISTINATGVVDSESEVLILSPGPGIIKNIYAEPGSRVNRGDLIMQLDTDNVKDDIERMKDQLEVRRNNLERTRLNAQSTRLDLDYNEEVKKLRITSLKSQLADQLQLLEVGGISPARIDQTKQEITLAEKDLQTLVEKNSIRLKQLESEEKGLLLQIRIEEKQLEEREQLIEKMSIRAPSAGIILSVAGRAGEKVGPDHLLVRMSDLSSFKITGSIDEQYANRLKTGNRVLVNIDNQEQLEGTVGNITPVVENNRIQFNVHLKESSHPKLMANQQVEIQIITHLKENALRLKKFKDLENENQHGLFVMEENRAIKKDFTLGIIGNEYVEILSGLNEGDLVVTDGLHAYRNQDEIEFE
jgi:HlyD family secretion protein